MKLPALLTAVLSSLDGAGLAQLLTITATQPGRHAVGVPRSAGVLLTASQPLATAPAAGAVRVFSAQRGGRLAGTLSTSGNTIRFAPNRAFQPGEQLNVTATTALQSAGGTALAAGQVLQFKAAALGGTGRLTVARNLQPGGSGWG